MGATMILNSSWLEGIACLVAAFAVVIGWRQGRAWISLGLLVLIGGWVLGSAKGLLFPAGVGALAFVLLWKSDGRWRMAGLSLALGGLLVSAFFCWLFPLPEIPELPGPFAVGTMSFEVPAAGLAPALVAQAWYPAKADPSKPRSRWLPNPELAPAFPFHRIGSALARSQVDLDLSAALSRFPVIFYEHSWTGNRAENVAQVASLASRGFVMIAVDHPGQSERVRYRDGSVSLSRLPATIHFNTEKAVRDFESLGLQSLNERFENLRRVKQALGRGIAPRLAGRLNLDKVGIFGFSFGGTSALHACALDPAFIAGANEDGYLLSDECPQGAFLFFDEEMPAWLSKQPGPGECPEDRLQRRSEARIQTALAGKDRFRMVLDHTRHEAFTDRIFTCRIARLARVGTRPAAEVHHLVTSRLAGFFQQELAEKLPLENPSPARSPE